MLHRCTGMHWTYPRDRARVARAEAGPKPGPSGPARLDSERQGLILEHCEGTGEPEVTCRCRRLRRRVNLLFLHCYGLSCQGKSWLLCNRCHATTVCDMPGMSYRARCNMTICRVGDRSSQIFKLHHVCEPGRVAFSRAQVFI